LKNLIKRLIEWAFFKYVCEPLVEEKPEEEPEDFEIVFEPEPEFQDMLDAMSYSCGGAWDLMLAKPKFDNEIDEAMYQKKFETIH
jgi:hypothetical protein